MTIHQFSFVLHISQKKQKKNAVLTSLILVRGRSAQRCEEADPVLWKYDVECGKAYQHRSALLSHIRGQVK